MYETESHKKSEFDDFLNKSAQKLKRIIKECSTSKKRSKGENKENSDEEYSPIKRSFQTVSYENESYQSKKPITLNKFQQKIEKLQENKNRLSERLSMISYGRRSDGNSLIL